MNINICVSFMGLIRETINLKCKVIKKETVYKSPTNVYDITVPNNHNFILANGAIVHNCDTYQSAQIKQQLISDGFDVQTISVDRLDQQTKQNLPYAYFKQTLYNGRLQVYDKCDLLTDEVLGLEKESDGHIQHPEGGTQGSKDAIDAIVGSLWNASQHADEYSYQYGEDLDAMQETNIDYDYTKDMNKSFEDMLKSIFKDEKVSSKNISNLDDWGADANVAAFGIII